MIDIKNMDQGNIVHVYHFDGCTVRVSDAAYAGKSKEELEQIKKNAIQIALEIDRRYQMREMGLL